MPASSLLDLSLAELTEALSSRTRALAVRRWLYSCRPVPAILPDRIPGVTPTAWRTLREQASFSSWRLVERQGSADGTLKYAIDVAGARFETVLIPARA